MPAAALAECAPGVVYGTGPDVFVVLGAASPAAGQRYLFLDGRRGGTSDPMSSVTCDGGVVSYASPAGRVIRWPRMSTRETDTTFESAATRLAGRLIEPPRPPDATRPLVVLVHGSEKTPAVGSVYAYMLAAQGVSVFAYDKRGRHQRCSPSGMPASA
jgi:hypothetical protein